MPVLCVLVFAQYFSGHSSTLATTSIFRFSSLLPIRFASNTVHRSTNKTHTAAAAPRSRMKSHSTQTFSYSFSLLVFFSDGWNPNLMYTNSYLKFKSKSSSTTTHIRALKSIQAATNYQNKKQKKTEIKYENSCLIPCSQFEFCVCTLSVNVWALKTHA